MRLLTEISDGSLGLSDQFEQLNSAYTLRKSARAILLDSEGRMATQHLQNYTYHKLPGGGVDPGESLEEALRREILEEVGCDSKILKPLGMCIEYRNKLNLLHISFCFVAQVVGAIGTPKLEEGEIEEGQTTLWITPKEALMKMKIDEPKKYERNFILKREITFLEEYIGSQ